MALLKYKKMFSLSASLQRPQLLLPGTEYGFGWPFAGWSPMDTPQLHLPSNYYNRIILKCILQPMEFSIRGITIYAVLLLMYKGLTKLNKDAEIGEK